MKFAKLSAFRSDGSMVRMEDIIYFVPSNNWVWTVIEFKATPINQRSAFLVEFEHKIKCATNGVAMSWADFVEFCQVVYQTVDCFIVASKPSVEVNVDELSQGIFLGCEAVIRVFDSSEWSVWINDARAMELLNKFAGE